MAWWNKIFKKDSAAEGAGGADRGHDPDTAFDDASAKKPVAHADRAPARFGPLRAPRSTEKASAMASGGTYVFLVDPAANKRAIAQAVEARYGVSVDRVRVMCNPPKERRRGRIIGWKPGLKKAAVRLKKGIRIESL